MPPDMQAVAEFATIFVKICGGFTAICIAGGWLIKIIAGLRKPETTQNDRLAKLEAKMETVERYLANDNRRINSIERGNRVTQEALLALLSHAIDGNNIDDLKSARKSLQNYLMDKGMEVKEGHE